MVDLPDQELVARVVAGDAAARDEFARRYRRLIKGVIGRMRLMSSAAAVASQEVWTKMLDDECRVLVLITDGHENSSRHYGLDQVAAMVRRQEKDYGWTFMFLGAGLDVIADAARLGMFGHMASGYAADGRGTAAAYRALSRNLARVRRGDGSGFTGPERKDMN